MDLLPMGLHLFLAPPRLTVKALKPIKDVPMHIYNWFISRDWGLRSQLSLFYCYSWKYFGVVSLLVKCFFSSVCVFVFTAQGFWLTGKTYVVNGHLGSCFREKSTAFDSRMPIGRGHQLLVFGSYLKAEMFYVALCPICGLRDRRLRLPFPDCSQRGVCRVVTVMPLQVMAAKDNHFMTNCVACL